MGDERRDDADQRRADVYSSARIGAAAALTLVLVVLLVLDVAAPPAELGLEARSMHKCQGMSQLLPLPAATPLLVTAKSGVVLVFDATTGFLQAILLDNSFLTELRTGAAGALAADLLAQLPSEVTDQVAALLAARPRVVSDAPIRAR